MTLTGEDIERIHEENRRRLWQTMAKQDDPGDPWRQRAAVRLREAEQRLNEDMAKWKEDA